MVYWSLRNWSLPVGISGKPVLFMVSRMYLILHFFILCLIWYNICCKKMLFIVKDENVRYRFVWFIFQNFYFAHKICIFEKRILQYYFRDWFLSNSIWGGSTITSKLSPSLKLQSETDVWPLEANLVLRTNALFSWH